MRKKSKKERMIELMNLSQYILDAKKRGEGATLRFSNKNQQELLTLFRSYYDATEKRSQ